MNDHRTHPAITDDLTQQRGPFALYPQSPDAEHPVIAELRSRPGEWWVIQKDIEWLPTAFGMYLPNPPYCDAAHACLAHDRIATAKHWSTVIARWMPDDEWAVYEARQMEEATRRVAEEERARRNGREV